MEINLKENQSCCDFDGLTFFHALRIYNKIFSKSILTLAAPARSCRLAPSLWKESDYDVVSDLMHNAVAMC